MNPDTFDRIMLESIAEEVKARDFYRQAAARMTDPGMKDIFEDLARQEDGHRDTLETFRFNPLARVEFEKVPDFLVAESQPDAAPGFDMSPRDAFQLAMKKEQKAMALYRKLADRCSDPQIRDLYLELSEMERGHKVMLEQMWINAAFPEIW